jgi:hypothetical protein
MTKKFEYSPSVMISPVATATSGPELAAYVPDPELARELAMTLIADQFDIAEQRVGYTSAMQPEVLALFRR